MDRNKREDRGVKTEMENRREKNKKSEKLTENDIKLERRGREKNTEHEMNEGELRGEEDDSEPPSSHTICAAVTPD